MIAAGSGAGRERPATNAALVRDRGAPIERSVKALEGIAFERRQTRLERFVRVGRFPREAMPRTPPREEP